MNTTQCIICNAIVPDIEGPVSEQTYLQQSPGCWKLYTEVLAREYGEWKYPPIHRLTVDCYAAQHPTLEPNEKSAQSVAVHLAGIYLALDKKIELHSITPMIGKIVDAHKGGFEWQMPPEDLGKLTIGDVHQAKTLDEHNAIVHQWAESVWNAWEAKQDGIRIMVKEVCNL